MSLQTLYKTPSQPGSFQGPLKVYQQARKAGLAVTQKDVDTYMQGESTYTLNRGVYRKIPRNRVVVEGIDSQWDIDLADMSQLAEQNDGYKYFMLAIDVFSRYVWVRPVKTKHAEVIMTALESVLKEGRHPEAIRTDGGREFQNKRMKDFLNKRDIYLFSTYNETQANYAERAIKTLKSKLYRYLIDRNTLRYVDVLQDLTHSYNKTKHSSLGRPPSEVNKDNESEVRLDQYLRRRKPKQPKLQTYRFDIGDHVRISYRREHFDREYGQKWSGEIFRVHKRRMREGIAVYSLKDWYGEDIKGTFYDRQLQKVSVSGEDSFKIEKILKRRKRRGKSEVYVKWLHWPKKFNSWIDASAVTDL